MITIKLEGIEEAIKTFDPNVVRAAARTAIDRATSSGKTIASDEIRKVWNVKRPELDPRIKITKPRLDDLTGVITISGRGMSLSYFGARQITGNRVVTRSKKQLKSDKIKRAMLKYGPLPQGVVVQVKHGKETVLMRNAFFAKVKAGKSGSHIGIFRRLSSKRLKIWEKNVISIASMAEDENVMTSVIKRIQERWEVEFPRQLDYYFSKSRP